MSGLLYAFYGDDFTGSTDVLEQLAMGGVRAALFFRPPTAEDLERHPDLQAVGVAGHSRSQTPEWMNRELPGIFTALHQLGAPVLHYKVCSTFDSSPQTGNIGRAMEIGLRMVGSRYAPVVVGAPHLRRFVLDGRLFAADPAGAIQRIDRHPMRHHPVTPMREPQLLAHLQRQTALPVAEVPLTITRATLREFVEAAVSGGKRALVFDTVTAGDLERIGKLLLEEALRQPLFAIGSSGLTAAFIAAWQDAVDLMPRGTATSDAAVQTASTKRTGPLLVLSGSCSPATEKQLRWALANGFTGIHVDPATLLRTDSPSLAALLEPACKALQDGQDTVLYTAFGAPSGLVQGDALGVALGQLLSSVLQRWPLRRVVFCGGDTSSHAIQQLPLRAMTWKCSLQPGAPLCQAHGEGVYDGLELILKGGQVGSEDFLGVVREA